MKKLLVLSTVLITITAQAAVEFDLRKGVDLSATNYVTASLLNQLVDSGTVSATNKGVVIRFNGGGGTRWPDVTLNPRYTNFLWLDQNTSPASLKQYVCCGDAYTNWVISTVTPGSITTTEIKDYTILAIDMATNSVPDYAIQAGAVSGNKIADNGIIAGKLSLASVTKGVFAFGAITGGDITNKGITYTNIADNTIGPDQIQIGTLSTATLTNGAVTTEKIATTNITRDLIRLDAVGTDQLTNNAVTSAKIADNTIVTNDLSTNISFALPKAWAVVNSGGTLLKGFNIASVTRTASGQYTLTFGGTYTPTTTNYVVSGTALDDGGGIFVVGLRTNETTRFAITTRSDSSVTDKPFSVMVIDF